MNKFASIFLFLFVVLSNLRAQTSYIQVNGEAGLSVFLNGQFKGKTSSDIGGYVIENVSPGQNKLKIVKDGYAPYEEVVNVKSGEVLAYQVKPFAKHTVLFSEQGNTKTTEKQAKIETGKLIIQSVPIEINISISDIEGAGNISKTKDKWLAESVPSGKYTIEFTYKDKKITKVVEILANETTNLFANMLNGEITMNNTIESKKAEEKLLNSFKKTMDSLCEIYSFKMNLSDYEFRKYNPEIQGLLPVGGGQRTNWKKKTAGPFYYDLRDGKVTSYNYILKGEVREDAVMQAYFSELLNYFKKIIPSKYLTIRDRSFKFQHPETKLEITYVYFPAGQEFYDRYSYVEMNFWHSNW